MKLIIAKDGIKREIEGPFDLCLSREVARWLRDQLRQADHDEFHYGWVKVSEEPPYQGAVNSPPKPWRE